VISDFPNDVAKGLGIRGQTTISINDDVGNYCRKLGMEGGAPPLSPLFFDLAVEPLDVILKKAKGARHIRGVIPHLIL
jgi:hypothetical protein